MILKMTTAAQHLGHASPDWNCAVQFVLTIFQVWIGSFLQQPVYNGRRILQRCLQNKQTCLLSDWMTITCVRKSVIGFNIHNIIEVNKFSLTLEFQNTIQSESKLIHFYNMFLLLESVAHVSQELAGEVVSNLWIRQ